MSVPSPSSLARRNAGNGPVRTPVMQVNAYDQLSAMLMSVVLLLIGVAAMTALWWYSTRPEQEGFLVPMEMLRSAGGSPDGFEGESLRVESPEDPVPDAGSGTENFDRTSGLTGLEIADFSSQEIRQQIQDFVVAPTDAGGRPGSAHGTGRKGLGSGDGDGGFSAEQRWFIRFANETSLPEYAKQLDFFGIELGALLPTGELIYLSQLAAPAPAQRKSRSGKDEKRLYMTWQGGDRKAADAKLFTKAGVDVSRAVLFQFYPAELEQKLLSKEIQYRKRKPHEIRRTDFTAVSSGNGCDFVVTRQTYLKQ